jgi:hypothetical protein
VTNVCNIDLSTALATLTKQVHAIGKRTKVRQQALDLIKDEALAAPAFCFRELPASKIESVWLKAGDTKLQVPGIQDKAAKLTSLVAIVCTLGPAFEARVSALFAERKVSLALALDELGSRLLFYTSRLATLQIRRDARRRNLSVGNALHPGDEGLAIDQQGTILAQAGGSEISVSLTGQGMLSPVKSMSMIVGIGIGLEVAPMRRRCENCVSRKQCTQQTC